MHRRVLFPVIALVLATVLVLADYYAVFGLRQTLQRVPLDVDFLVLDAASGQPLTGVQVTCFRRGTRNACVRREPDGKANVGIRFEVVRRDTRTWLFHKSSHIEGGSEVEVNVMFIRPDYGRRIRTYDINELLDMSQGVTRILLKRP